MENNEQRWTIVDNSGQQWTLDNNRQQSAVLHASLVVFFCGTDYMSFLGPAI